MPRQLRNRPLAYVLAFAFPFLALMIRIGLGQAIGNRAPFAFFFIGTLFVAPICGLGPGLVATAVGGILADYFVLYPVRQWGFESSQDAISMVIYLLVSGFICAISEQLVRGKNREYSLRMAFQQTLLSIADAIISTDRQGRVQLMNGVAEQLTGWKYEEAKGSPIEDVFRLVRAGSDSQIPNPIRTVVNSGQTAALTNHAELVARDGRRLPIDHTASPVTNQRGEMAGTVLVFRDVTQRYQAEQALAAAEKRARTILDSIRDAFFLLDPEWRFAQVNPAAEVLLRQSSAELLGKDFWQTYPHLLGSEVETRYRAAMREHTPQRFEFLSPVSGIYAAISAFPSEEGLAVYFHDISERKREEADLRRLNEDLKQFTYAASHDLREPLRMITVYSELLTETLGPQLESRPAMFLANMVAGAQRIGRLIDGLLLFTQMGALGAGKGQPVNAVESLEDAIELLHLQLEDRGAQVNYGEMPVVLAEPSHLAQVFQNLIANALKYTDPDVAPVVDIHVTQGEHECTFCVRDNGIGIDPKFQSQIFQPFKRLHGPEVPGAGIGLATCKRIIEHYGGHIWVRSEGQGKGSEFCFSLPLAVQDQPVAHP